jgi:hypothetical protein
MLHSKLGQIRDWDLEWMEENVNTFLNEIDVCESNKLDELDKLIQIINYLTTMSSTQIHI